MLIPFLVLSTFFFGGISIYLSYSENGKEKKTKMQDREIKGLYEQLRAQDARLESLIGTLPIGTVLFTEINGLLDAYFVNPAARSYLGVSEDANADTIIDTFDSSLKIRDLIQQVLTTGQGVSVLQTKISDRDFKLYFNPVFIDGVHYLVGVALIIYEVTAEHKLEKVRTDMTDMMIHELRAPTTAIRGAAALLLSDNIGPEEKKKMPQLIMDSANDMLATVSDFLDMSRIDEGKFKLNLADSDICKVIQEHIDIFSYAAKQKDIVINFEKSDGVPNSSFDPVRIGQVINNLLSNSIKFTEGNGVIDIKVKAEDGQILVEVDDNGIGIPESKKSMLFKKFGQIEHKLGQGASSGLGLYISRQIIDAHGGKIWLESQEGKGTKVYFSLPVVANEPAQEEETKKPALTMAN